MKAKRLIASILCGSLLTVSAFAAGSGEIMMNSYAGAPLVANADYGTPATHWDYHERMERFGEVKDGCISFTDAQANGGKLDLSSVSTAGFVDWDTSQWWASRDSVKYTIGMGYVNGRKVADGTALCANDPVTKTEFVAVLVRMTVKPEVIEECRKECLEFWAQGQGKDPSKPETEKEFREAHHWAYTAGYIKAADKAGIANMLDIWTSENETKGDAPCDRVTMARYIYNACYARGEEQMSIDTSAATGVFKDVSGLSSNAKKYIGWVAGSGLIGGDNAGKFNPNSTMDRASMCEVIYRLDNPVAKDGTTPREKVIEQLFGGTSNVPQDHRYGQGGTAEIEKAMAEAGITEQNLAPITIDMRNPGRHRCPYPGDTVIRPDGSTVVLKFDEHYGILGWGQNCDPWTGTISVAEPSNPKADVEIGTLGGGEALGATIHKDYYNDLAMDSLYHTKMTGGDWEAHWTFEFESVKLAKEVERDAVDGKTPKYEGQVSTDGYWQGIKSTTGKLIWVYLEHGREGIWGA